MQGYDIHIKWKGIKKGDFSEVSPNSESFWETFFTNYVKPQCEIDKTPLRCKSIDVSRVIDSIYGYGSRHVPSQGELIIEVELVCPMCGTEYSGIGTDIKMEANGWVGIGSFTVHTTKFNVPFPKS